MGGGGDLERPTFGTVVRFLILEFGWPWQPQDRRLRDAALHLHTHQRRPGTLAPWYTLPVMMLWYRTSELLLGLRVHHGRAPARRTAVDRGALNAIVAKEQQPYGDVVLMPKRAA